MYGLKSVEIHLSLPVFFLLSFAVCSETVRSGFGIDFSFVLLVVMTFYYFFCYKYAVREVSSYYWWFYILLVPVFLSTVWNGGDMLHMIACALILLL